MAYNLSPKTVERMKPHLDRLDGSVVEFITDAPHKLGYRLREAIAAAQRHKISPYRDIDYTFKIERGNTLRAVPKVQVNVEHVNHGVPIPERKISSEVNHFEVIQICTREPESRFIFPHFNGSLEPVQRWAEKHGFTVEEDPLTLTRNEDD